MDWHLWLANSGFNGMFQNGMNARQAKCLVGLALTVALVACGSGDEGEVVISSPGAGQSSVPPTDTSQPDLGATAPNGPNPSPGPVGSPGPEGSPGPAPSPGPDASPGPAPSPGPVGSEGPVPSPGPSPSPVPVGSPGPNPSPGPDGSPGPTPSSGAEPLVPRA